MRVIGGVARGRRLYAPDLPGLRPTSDFVREAMFDILESRGLVEGARVLDLFAGSGALGIEALSRGAAEVTFVEQDRRAAAAISRNLDVTGFADARGVRVVRADALGWVESHAPQAADLALADPPYAFDEWPRLFGHLSVATVLVEHRAPLQVGGGYAVSRAYRYGGTLVTLVLADRVGNGVMTQSGTDPDTTSHADPVNPDPVKPDPVKPDHINPDHINKDSA
ncbi:MAG: RsmD family RNA methyltransferase [Acidimicrobiales bacterium]